MTLSTVLHSSMGGGRGLVKSQAQSHFTWEDERNLANVIFNPRTVL